MGLDDEVRLAHVATRFHLEGRSRIEIADELGVSRFKVARMLEQAEEAGIVQISIRAPSLIDPQLSMRLRDELGLTRALAVTTPTDAPEVVQDYLGRVAASVLSDVVRPGEVLGLTAGRTLGVMARHVGPLARCEVVQLSGVAGPIQSTAVEILRRVSRAARDGVAYTMFAPLVTSDPGSAAAIRRQMDVARTSDQLNRVTVAMVAIGSWTPPDSQFHDNPALDEEMRERLVGEGVQADIGAVLIDAKGRAVTTMAGVTVGADYDQLRHIPDVIGVAGGVSKAGAIRAAINSGLIGSLITDSATAKRLLA